MEQCDRFRAGSASEADSSNGLQPCAFTTAGQRLGRQLLSGWGRRGEIRAFRILGNLARIGFVRLFDPEDVDDGSVQIELGVVESQQARGVGPQAVAWLTRFLFENDPHLHRIEASTREDNAAMRLVLELHGYRLEGLLRETWRSDDGTRYDTVLYGRLRNEG